MSTSSAGWPTSSASGDSSLASGGRMVAIASGDRTPSVGGSTVSSFPGDERGSGISAGAAVVTRDMCQRMKPKAAVTPPAAPATMLTRSSPIPRLTNVAWASLKETVNLSFDKLSPSHWSPAESDCNRHRCFRLRSSAQLAPALQFRLAWLGVLEVARLDRAVGNVVRDDHAGRVGFRLDQLQPSGRCAAAEDALPLAQDQREDQHAELVDQRVLPQGLKQFARSLREQVGAILALQRLERRDRVIAQPPAVLPGQIRVRTRGDVFRDPVEQPGDRVVRVGDVGPVRREDVVGLAAEQQVERPAEDIAHGAAQRLVEMGGGPAAEGEAAGRVLLRAAGRLHDAVEAG